MAKEETLRYNVALKSATSKRALLADTMSVIGVSETERVSCSRENVELRLPQHEHQAWLEKIKCRCGRVGYVICLGA